MKSLTVSQVRYMDKLAVKKYGIPSIILMENAGQGLTHVIQTYLDRWPPHTQVIVIGGGGNNAGDGFVAARRLHQAGHAISIYLCQENQEYKGDALVNFDIVKKLKIPVFPFKNLDRHLHDRYQNVPLLLVDAMLGTGFKPPLKPSFSEAISFLNDLKKSHSAKISIISVDIPSGLNGDKGNLPRSPAIRSDCTVTFVAPKKGFNIPGSKQFIKKLVVVDIGIPNELQHHLRTSSN